MGLRPGVPNTAAVALRIDICVHGANLEEVPDSS